MTYTDVDVLFNKLNKNAHSLLHNALFLSSCITDEWKLKVIQNRKMFVQENQTEIQKKVNAPKK